MKKTTKGAIAAGAAAVLLAGGAGSFAAWNASTTGGDQTVTAGSMTISQKGEGAWTLGSQPFNPDTDKIVPGDVVEYTATYEYDLVGSNLTATLKPTVGGISGDLAEQLDVDTVDGDAATVNAGKGERTITTTITFDPKVDGFDNSGQGLQATLSGASVTLEQILP